MRRFWKKRLL